MKEPITVTITVTDGDGQECVKTEYKQLSYAAFVAMEEAAAKAGVELAKQKSGKKSDK